MRYNDKLQLFFKSKNLSQKKAAEIMEVSPAMMGRYLRGLDNFSSEFVSKLLKEFPEIDLQYIFREDDKVNGVYEPNGNYTKKDIDVVKELELIEEKIVLIKQSLARNSHAK